MRILKSLALVLLSVAAAQAAVPQVSPIRPVATYSIVARATETGEMGVAVQSHWFNVGGLVPWARAGVGAVATQSMVDPSYGAEGLVLMADGVPATVALEQLLAADEHSNIRQVAMIDGNGNVAAHTGSHCIEHAGHVVGVDYSVQANLMGPATVPQAMTRAFEAAQGALPERLVAALAAAQAAGGDIRGRQSAAILVVRGEATGRKWDDVVVDLRVEDNPDPVVELTRLLQMHRGYEMMNAGDLAVEEGNLRGADYFYGEAERILAGNPEARFWHAVALVNAGKVDESLPLFAKVFHADENWRTLVPRLIKPGFLDADAAVLSSIISVIPPQR